MHTSRLKVHLSCSSSLHGALVRLFKTREDSVKLMFAETLVPEISGHLPIRLGLMQSLLENRQIVIISSSIMLW